MFADFKYAVRILAKSPGFTALAVVTLALAIGANTLAFGVFNGMVLRPLNAPRAHGLYAIDNEDKQLFTNVSYPDYLDLRDRNRSFEDLAALTHNSAGFDTGGNPARACVCEVTGNYFDVLGLQPFLGRFFHQADEHGPNSAPYVVLSYSYWHAKFQDDRGVIGRTVRINKHSFTVIGVAPPGFDGIVRYALVDFFVPFVNQRQFQGADAFKDRGYLSLMLVFGHLRAGITPKQASADLNSVGAYLDKTYPEDHVHTTFLLSDPTLFGRTRGNPMREFVSGVLVFAALVLLGACVNLGTLFAARVADRSRDIALRLALGGSRIQVVRPLLAQALLISVAGGSAGLWGSVVLLHRLSAWRPFSDMPVAVPANPDARVYVAALVLALFSGILFSLVPLRQVVLKADPYQVLKAGPGGAVGRRFAFRDGLLFAQIAICAVLVTSSLVAVRGLARSLHSHFGFEPKNVLLAGTNLRFDGYRGDRRFEIQRRLIDAVRTLPGITAVGLTSAVPLSDLFSSTAVYSDKTAVPTAANYTALAVSYAVSPEYFRAAGTQFLAGNPFTWHDNKDAAPVAVVNQTLARRLFGSVENAVGQYFKTAGDERIRVVGVVENGKYMSLTEDPRLAIFLPLEQAPSDDAILVVRSERDPEELASAVRNVLHKIDPALPFLIQPWSKALDRPLFPSRIAALSLGVIGGIGAVLVITGIFGAAAYSVSKRTREFGIRLALGAGRFDVLRAALGRTLKLLLMGSAMGLMLGLLSSRLLASIIYQATPGDPLVLAGVVLTMLLLALVAAWVPAQRVLSFDPAVLLREE